jgi:MFS superfamily sulfate permease-like transporter
MKAAILHAFCNILFLLFLADVIQSIGLLISSLVIFFLGSDMGAEVT